MNHLHVLLLPSWYPTKYAPTRGIFFLEQAIALRKAGIQTGVIYPDFRSWRTLTHNNISDTHFQISYNNDNDIPTIRFHGWNPLSARLRYRFFITIAKKLWEEYTDHWGHPDVIHAHSALWGGVAASVLSNQTNIPYIITEHSSGYARDMIRPWQQKLIKNAIQGAAQFITVSKSLKQTLKTYRDADKITVIPNMVDTTFFTLSPVRHNTPPFRFLTVASLVPVKGINILLHSFAIKFKGNNDVILEIGGDGPERHNLEKLAVNLGIQKQVSFLGYLDRYAVKEAMWRANTFVSTSYVETFGVVLIEAMATGLPVIATRCGGPEEIITPGTGILVHPGDENELAEAMIQIKEQRESFAKETEIRAAVVNKYEQKVIVDQLISILSSVANNVPPTTSMT
jgi:glycosyltransferase involved in cell wall biosynthesis